MTSVSVVIPAYNAEKYIAEAIASVQAQTFAEFELIVVDDGSTDQTLSILQGIDDPRLKIVLGTHQGVSAARNRGMAKAKGEYIALLDADDLWSPDKLESHVLALSQNPKVGLAYSWTYYWTYTIDDLPAVTSLISPQASGSEAYRAFLEENLCANGSNIFVRRAAVEAMGSFDETLSHGEDWEFCFRVSLAWDVALIPKAQVFYRQHGNSLCSDIETAQISTLKAVDKMFERAPVALQRLKPKTYANLHLFLAGLYLARTHPEEGIRKARENWLQSIQVWPLSLFGKNSWSLFFKLIVLSVLPKPLAKSLLHKVRSSINQAITISAFPD